MCLMADDLSDNLGARLIRARVVWNMRYPRGDVEEISRPNRRMVLQSIAIPAPRDAAQLIDGRLVLRMEMRFGTGARRNGCELKMHMLRSHTFN